MTQNLIATYEFPWKVVNDANQKWTQTGFYPVNMIVFYSIW